LATVTFASHGARAIWRRLDGSTVQRRAHTHLMMLRILAHRQGSGLSRDPSQTTLWPAPTRPIRINPAPPKMCELLHTTPRFASLRTEHVEFTCFRLCRSRCSRRFRNSACGTFRPSRSEPWKRSRRSALGSDSGPWKPRVPRAGSHPQPTFEAPQTSDRLGWKAAAHPALSDMASVEP